MKIIRPLLPIKNLPLWDLPQCLCGLRTTLRNTLLLCFLHQFYDFHKENKEEAKSPIWLEHCLCISMLDQCRPPAQWDTYCAASLDILSHESTFTLHL